MKISVITSAIEQAAPLKLQESYDNAGLLVGCADTEIDSALLCVDITESVLGEAIEIGAGLIVSHHPVIFHPLKHITGNTYIERVVAGAIRHGVALYASHTNLDSAPGGMSWRLGNLLGLKNVTLLGEPSPHDPEAGFGIVGDVGGEIPTMDYLRHVQKTLGIEVIRHSGITRTSVTRVALCTGAGSSMARDARRAGAELYISADFRYNDFLDADRELVIADIGHFESEYCAIDLIYDIIIKKFPTFAIRKSTKSINPVKYLAK